MQIALLGLGTVGGGVYELIDKRRDMAVKYVCCLEQPQGLRAILTRSLDRILEDPEVDTVVEVMGGLHPAREFVIRSMQAGKNIVTANKLLVATCYDELTQLARSCGVAFRCTAAAGGGIPWLTALERCRRVDEISSIYGIMNGTTNFILDSMHQKNVTFDAILLQAQQLGYAEKDPSADIDGLDILNKLVISANVAYGVSVPPAQADVIGIRNIRQMDIQTFLSRGLWCRLLATSEKLAGGLTAYVEPTLVPQESPEAAVHANFNLINFDGKFAGRQSFYGQGAGRYPTAYNVVEDLVDVKEGVSAFYTDEARPIDVANELAKHRYYVRTAQSDPWLTRITAEHWQTGVLTEAVSVREMHDWAKGTIEKDPELFIAAVRN